LLLALVLLAVASVLGGVASAADTQPAETGGALDVAVFPESVESSENAAWTDPAGTMRVAWVSASSATGRSLQTAAITPSGIATVQELDRLPARTDDQLPDVATQLAPTPDGGAALLWTVDRHRGGPLRIATAPPGQVGLGAPAVRDMRPRRRSLDFDVSPAADRSWFAVLQHIVDGAGNETGSATISVMPIVAPTELSGNGTQRPQPDARHLTTTTTTTLIVALGKPRVRRGVLSLRVLCRHAQGRCSGYVMLTAKGRTSTSRRFTMRGSAATMTSQLQFSGPRTSRLLRARRLTITLSARTGDGRVGAARRTLTRPPGGARAPSIRGGQR
jgi:hypothetical protein